MRDALNEEFGCEVFAEHEDEDVDGLVETAEVADIVEDLRRISLTDCLKLILSELNLVQDAILDETFLIIIFVVDLLSLLGFEFDLFKLFVFTVKLV